MGAVGKYSEFGQNDDQGHIFQHTLPRSDHELAQRESPADLGTEADEREAITLGACQHLFQCGLLDIGVQPGAIPLGLVSRQR